LINDTALPITLTNMQQFAVMAGERVMTGNDSLIQLAAKIGTSEARIDTALSRNAAEKLTLEIATAELVQSDPFTLATELEAVQTNLETLYAVTARLSRLNLTDFIR
jgi:flagellar hook-associated protein 3 FlgL